MVNSCRATREIRNLPDNNNVRFAELPEQLRRLLFFAKPDVVICYDNGTHPVRPVFAFELTYHMPARDHWLQRFNNLVGCAQIGVPGAYVLPTVSEYPSSGKDVKLFSHILKGKTFAPVLFV